MYSNLAENGVLFVRHTRNKRKTRIGRLFEKFLCAVKDLMSAR